MKFSQAFLKKIARISDHVDVDSLEPKDSVGQSYFEGMEDAGNTNKIHQALKNLAGLEDLFWETLDEKVNTGDLDEFEIGDLSDRMDDELEAYDEWFDENIGQYYKDLNEEDQQQFKYDFLKEDEGRTVVNKFNPFYERMIEDVASKDDDFLNSLVQSYFEHLRPDVVKYLSDNLNGGEEFDANTLEERLVNMASQSSKAGIIKTYFIKDEGIGALLDGDEWVWDDMMNYYKSNPIPVFKGIDGLWDEFKDFLVDNISQSDKDRYIKDHFEDEIIQNMEENERDYIAQEAPMEILRHMARGHEVEINEIIEVNEFFTGDQWEAKQFKEYKEWNEEIAPIVSRMEDEVAKLPTEVQNKLNEKLPQSNKNTRNLERAKEQFTKKLGYEPSDEETKFFAQHPEIYNDLLETAELIGKEQQLSYAEYRDLKTNHPEEIERLKVQRLKEKQHEEAIGENEEFDQNKEEQRKKIERDNLNKKHQLDVEKSFKPLDDKNQQLMLNLVNKVKQKGSIDKNTLMNFLNNFKPVNYQKVPEKQPDNA